eukprot:2532734-Alexandrium_andersonii.AAC.1
MQPDGAAGAQQHPRPRPLQGTDGHGGLQQPAHTHRQGGRKQPPAPRKPPNPENPNGGRGDPDPR